MDQRLRTLAGAALAGYGLLVLLGVLAHDAPLAGVLSLVLGAALLLPILPAAHVGRPMLVAGLGVACAGGVLLYNLLAGSGLSLPEVGLLLYGLALLAAAPFLARRVGPTEVGSLVGWSFALVLAPLALFALNAVASSGGTGTAAAPIIASTLVTPTAAGLALLGTPSQVIGNNIVLATPRGTLSLGIGLVCAGLYPMVLFAGVVGLHGWQTRMRPWRIAAILVLGLAGLWVANLIRLIALAKVGQEWGAEALQTAHAHLGWVLFALFMAVFWAVLLRRAPQGAIPQEA